MSEPTIIVALVSGTVTVLGSLLLWASTRGKTKVDSKAALDARVDERISALLDSAWKRIDDLEKDSEEKRIEIASLNSAVDDLKITDRRKMSAVARIFRAIARQWPTATGPDLDPHDIAEIEDTIPSEWIRRPPPTSITPPPATAG